MNENDLNNEQYTVFHIQDRRNALRNQIGREEILSQNKEPELIEKNGLLLFRSVEVENWENALDNERESAIASHCF